MVGTAFSRHNRLPIKKPVPGMSYVLRVVCQQGTIDPRILQITTIALGYPSKYNTEKTTYWSHKTWRIKAGIDLRTSCLVTSFHGTRKLYAY